MHLQEEEISIAEDGDQGAPELKLPSLDEQTDDEVTPAVAPRRKVSTRTRPYLVALAGCRTGEIFPVGRKVVVGRGKGASLHLPDDRVSRCHAEVRVVDEQLLRVRDLGSTNGTFMYGNRISEHLLREGERIELGDGNILRASWFDPIEERFQRRLADAALRDVLTPAYNRRYLRQRLLSELAFAQRHHTPVALLVIDVDHFKEINDQFGHLIGDAILERLAETLLSELRGEDVLARWGGEEFAVLARSTTDMPALVLGERIRHRVAATRFQHGRPIHVSIGIAVYPSELDLRELPERSASSEEVGPSLADEMIGNADEALYCAKRHGRNRVVTSAEVRASAGH